MTTALGTRDGGEIAVAFSRVLRGAGIDVPTSSTIAFGEALAATGLNDRQTTYWAGRATLVRRPEDHELYDRAFRVFWDHASASVELQLDEPLHVTLAIDDDADDDRSDPDRVEASDDPVIELRFSATEVLRQKDFADYTPEELIEAQQLMSNLRLVGSPRRSLRLTGADRRTDRPDLRRTIRAAMRSGGEPTPTSLSATEHPQPQAGAAARREWIDGAVCQGADPIRTRRRGRPPEGRGVRRGDATDASRRESSPHATPTRRCSGRRHGSPILAVAPGSATG